MSAIEERIESLGYTLSEAATPVANYVTAARAESAGLVFLSGHVPMNPDGSFMAGKLGAGMSVDEGYEAAKATALTMLGSLKASVGDLDRVSRIVKLFCMVNCTPDFDQQPAVANGASDLMVEVFGEKGRHARAAVGMVSLPGGACVEIEMVAEVSG